MRIRITLTIRMMMIIPMMTTKMVHEDLEDIITHTLMKKEDLCEQIQFTENNFLLQSVSVSLD